MGYRRERQTPAWRRRLQTAQSSLLMAAAPAVLRLHPHKGPRGGSVQLQLVNPQAREREHAVILNHQVLGGPILLP